MTELSSIVPHTCGNEEGASGKPGGEGEGWRGPCMLLCLFTVLSFQNFHCPLRRNLMRGGSGVGVDGEDKNRFPGSM